MFLRPSSWSYETGATGGLGFGYVVGSGGKIILNDPTGTQQTFWYGGLGGGISAGFRIGKIKMPPLKIKGASVPASAAGSTTWFPSGGVIYMRDTFKGTELAASDIKGATVYIDAGLGALIGGSGSAMILGINPLPLIIGLSNPLTLVVAEEAIRRAPAVLIMGGVNVGPQFGAGIGGLVGYLR